MLMTIAALRGGKAIRLGLRAVFVQLLQLAVGVCRCVVQCGCTGAWRQGRFSAQQQGDLTPGASYRSTALPCRWTTNSAWPA